MLLTVGLFDIVIQVYAPPSPEISSQAIPVLRQMLFGATLIVVLMFRPLGILGRDAARQADAQHAPRGDESRSDDDAVEVVGTVSDLRDPVSVTEPAEATSGSPGRRSTSRGR